MPRMKRKSVAKIALDRKKRERARQNLRAEIGVSLSSKPSDGRVHTMPRRKSVAKIALDRKKQGLEYRSRQKLLAKGSVSISPKPSDGQVVGSSQCSADSARVSPETDPLPTPSKTPVKTRNKVVHRKERAYSFRDRKTLARLKSEHLQSWTKPKLVNGGHELRDRKTLAKLKSEHLRSVNKPKSVNSGGVSRAERKNEQRREIYAKARAQRQIIRPLKKYTARLLGIEGRVMVDEVVLRCPVCKEEFNKKTLPLHMSKVHTVNDRVSCIVDDCVWFGLISKVATHILKEHSDMSVKDLQKLLVHASKQLRPVLFNALREQMVEVRGESTVPPTEDPLAPSTSTKRSTFDVDEFIEHLFETHFEQLEGVLAETPSNEKDSRISAVVEDDYDPATDDTLSSLTTIQEFAKKIAESYRADGTAENLKKMLSRFMQRDSGVNDNDAICEWVEPVVVDYKTSSGGFPAEVLMEDACEGGVPAEMLMEESCTSQYDNWEAVNYQLNTNYGFLKMEVDL